MENYNTLERNEDMKRFNLLKEVFPIRAILGPRQCGKTTFSHMHHYDHYFDLENPRDLGRLDNPQLALEDLSGTIVIDEIQRKPELFPLLRYLVDSNKEVHFIILGSASRDLIKQSSESLAGRIGYYYLSGFRLDDTNDYKQLWVRGGYPRAYLAKNDQQAHIWIQQYILTFLERDIPQLGISIPAQSLHRFWTMLSHYHGQIVNFSEFARSFGITDHTVRRYIDILEGTFMIRLLRPWHTNVKKRLVKTPKMYLTDSGIFHHLQSIQSFDDLNAHPKLGASFEGFAIDCVCRSIGLPYESFYFYRTSAGLELDLFWQYKGKNWGVEVKYNDAPKKTKSMKMVSEDLSLEHLWVVYPGLVSYQLDEKISVRALSSVKGEWDYAIN